MESHSTRNALAAALLITASAAMADAPAGRYVVSTETVLDTKTTLLWQRTAPATAYADHALAGNYCTTLALGGHNVGWRLPTRKELLSMVDTRMTAPPMDGTFAPTTDATYWTSTRAATGVTCGFMGSSTNCLFTVTFQAGGWAGFEPSPGTCGNCNYRARCVWTP